MKSRTLALIPIVAVAPAETKELTFTFAEPGATLAGCHVAGHYAGGMRADITVTE